MTLSREDQLNINLILSNIMVLDELIHNVKDSGHQHNLKRYYNELFRVVKRYRKEIDRVGALNEQGMKDLENVYDKQMEVIYIIREIARSEYLENPCES